jgi:hypothetical protein
MRLTETATTTVLCQHYQKGTTSTLSHRERDNQEEIRIRETITTRRFVSFVFERIMVLLSCRRVVDAVSLFSTGLGLYMVGI